MDKTWVHSGASHMKGGFGHAQDTLRHLFKNVGEDARKRITIGSFLDLFPHVGLPPTAEQSS
ncbi:hypothetical protein [Nocardioides sp. Iso805N]|uniref:hypothetical protein n=1 Tax=Nocardioides sp. Iso805N TaxID=1283287 RepID=UPI000367018E|nr:hypothetical protein [Nocardioides sp. Iso805N]